MVPPAEGLKILLLQAPAAGVEPGTNPADWEIYIGEVPANVGNDKAIIINETGSWQMPHPTLLLNYPTAQVLIRSSEDAYVTGRQKAEEVKDRLLAVPSLDIDGDRYISILMATDILSLGRDDRRRPMWSTNWNLITEVAPSATTTRTPLA